MFLGQLLPTVYAKEVWKTIASQNNSSEWEYLPHNQHCGSEVHLLGHVEDGAAGPLHQEVHDLSLGQDFEHSEERFKEVDV